MNLKSHLLRFWNLWPPFIFTGIKITYYSKDFTEVKVRLKLRFWNANFVGTQYGGTMFSMTDPFYMVMLLKNLGDDYIVWDKSATIRYIKPGKTQLTAYFKIEPQELEDIRSTVQQKGKMDWVRKIEVRDANNEVVAEVEKIIYIRKKKTIS